MFPVMSYVGKSLSTCVAIMLEFACVVLHVVTEIVFPGELFPTCIALQFLLLCPVILKALLSEEVPIPFS